MTRLVEHFASSLGSWSPLTAGIGTMAVSDHMAVGTLNGASDAAALYKAFDPSKNQIIWICAAAGLGAGAALTPWPALRLIHSPTAPVAGTRASFNILAQHIYYTSGGVTYNRIIYTDSGATQQRWSEASQGWSTSTSTLSMLAAAPIDDFRLSGIEWDATNSQMRLLAGHVVTGSAENADYGPRLTALTDWIPLASIQNGGSSTLWLVIGSPENNFFSAADTTFGVEWTSETSGTDRVHTFCNGKQSIGGTYNITHNTGYDWRAPYLVPGTRGQIAIDVGAGGAWDNTTVQWGSAILAADGKFVQSYSGNNSGNITVGIATATSAFGPWTKYPSNPIITLTPATDYSAYIRFNVLVEDWQEADPNKRYKLIVNANDGSVNRTLLFYAAAYTGPYTYDGRLLEDDGTETQITVNGQPVWESGQWHVFYNASVAGVTTVRYATCATLRAGQAVKASTTLLSAAQGAVEVTLTAVSGRIWTCADTTGLVKDMKLGCTKTASGDTYDMTAVRKVLSATQFEVYHSCPGAGVGTVCRSLNYGNDLSYVNMKKLEGIWYAITTPFKVFDTHLSYATHIETTALFVGGATLTDPYTIDWTATPVTPLGRDAWNTTISNENMRIVHTPTRFVQGGGTLALSLGLAGTGTVGGSTVSGSGTLPLALGLAGTGVVGSTPVIGTGTLALTLALQGAGSVTVGGVGALALALHLVGAGTVGGGAISGAGLLVLPLRLAGAAAKTRVGAGVLALTLALRGSNVVTSGTGWRLTLKAVGYRWRLSWRSMTPNVPFPVPIAGANDAGVLIDEVAGYEVPSGTPLIYTGASLTAYWSPSEGGTTPIGAITKTVPRNSAPPRFAVAFEASEMSTILATLPAGSPVWLVLEGAGDFRAVIEHVVRGARVLG